MKLEVSNGLKIYDDQRLESQIQLVMLPSIKNEPKLSISCDALAGEENIYLCMCVCV